MITQETLDQYEMTIGIECHVQLKTKSKLFAGDDNMAREASPNQMISTITMGLPGVLPVLNDQAVELAIRAGHALNASVATFSKFDRKHYFYPDLPKGYQITQFDEPTVGEGSIAVPLDDQTLTVGITRAHLEEDAGKLTHPAGKDYSLVDLNRAGTPLLEIVSEPDMHSPAEARAFAQELYLLMKYADVSDVDLFHGNMRFDVNLSVAKKGSKKLGTRSETKNLNSFRSIEKAAEYEFKRQVELLEKGQEVVQETRGWDDAKMKTISQRTKEDAHDYRYFPDPDIPPVVISQSHIDEVKAAMPKMPADYRTAFAELGLTSASMAVLIDEPILARTVLNLAASASKEVATKIANLFINQAGDSETAITTDYSTEEYLQHLTTLADMVIAKDISSNAADEVFAEFQKTLKDPREIAEDKQLIQNSDEGAIEAIVDAVIAENESAAQDVRDGEMKAIGFLVGQVMKQSKGQANPQIAKTILQKKLS